MSQTRIRIYQVDAFSRQVFSGNPAAVCPLEEWLPDNQMQAIAGENNLSETAFFVRGADGYGLRWFTPAVEIDLCGHATLATAFIILNELTPSENSVRFQTKSGTLVVTRESDLFSLDFPSRPPGKCEAHSQLVEALGASPEAVLAARDYLVVYASEDEIRKLEPNIHFASQLDKFAVIATAPGKDVDFVSRFF